MVPEEVLALFVRLSIRRKHPNRPPDGRERGYIYRPSIKNATARITLIYNFLLRTL